TGPGIMKRSLLVLVLPLPFVVADAPKTKPELPPAVKRTVDFARDVRPILEQSCVGCHNAATQRGGLRLDVGARAMDGGEGDAVLNDKSPEWYEHVVDRLLASPHYGERWGRHWLDLARYADSDGYEKDTGRPFAWRWRNWVINALNADRPFDQFTIEQLAGDL